MKKELLTICLLTGVFSVAYGYPAPDMTVGGAPFQIMQQQTFQKVELNDYKKFKDANDRPAETRTDSPEKLKNEYKIKNFKSKNTQFRLNNKPSEEFRQISNPENMEFVQQDGKIMLKYAE